MSTSLSQYSAARFRSCSTAMTVIFRPLSPLSMSSTCTWCDMSRCEVGSSSSINRGSWASAFAISTLCLSPALSRSIGRDITPAQSVAATARSTASISSFDSDPNILIYGNLPIITTSNAVNGKTTAGSDDTNATDLAKSFCGIENMSRRPKDTEPDSGCSTRLIVLMSVDLPAPFGPIIPINSPSDALKETSLTTVFPA
ncbi:MAG TPA: hypothetical protein PLV09_04275 [Candidatus Omnitrophota bacterium]|nr:hypothetical protein [Candidatus Omnitrophota bacterium]HRZ66890.1 hypothetical protein [Candidatus Omnitrophota bacterium]